MPYSNVSEVPDYVPKDKKKQWMEVWNSAHKAAKKKGMSDKDAEASAFAQANGVVKKEGKSMDKHLEVRMFPKSELRVSQDGKIAGYAAVFNEQYDSDFFIETIKPGAFSRALREAQDIRCLYNHNANSLLGRTKAGTLP